MIIYPSPVTFTDGYSKFEKYVLHRGLFNACKLVYDAMLPSVGTRMDTVFNGLAIEFVSEPNAELNDAGAIGLAYKDRNLNLMPAHFDLRTFQMYSGIFTMELTHSVIWRLTNSLRTCNDLIHWLYNEEYVATHSWLSALTVLKFGSSAKFLVPDMKYGWSEKDEIMAGIRSGKYKEAQHEYWSDPLFTAPLPSVVAATKHDLDHIRDILGL